MAEKPELPFFALARRRGWTREELAYRSGLSMAMIESLRVGRRNPGYRTVAGLRRAFPGHSLEELFGPAFEAGA